jgi:hypothetical protein
MKARRLPALEKNVLKYRALQMVLMLHEFESLKRFIINSLRASDEISGTSRLPVGCKKPLETALDLLVVEKIIEPHEKLNLLEFGTFRNRIGHEVHSLVADVTAPDRFSKASCLHDYWALTHLERLRTKISNGMGACFVLVCSLDSFIFEPAELAFKEELERLDRKIQRQISVRLSRPGPNNSFKPKPLRGSA